MGAPNPVDALFAGAPAAPAASGVTQQQPAGAAVDALFAGAPKSTAKAPSAGWRGALEDALGIPVSGVGSMVTGPAAGLAGIAGTLLPGQTGQGARWTQGIQNATTYQPRTQAGSIASRLMGAVPRAIDEGGDWAGGKTTDVLSRLGVPAPLAAANGASVRAGIDVAPMFLERLLGITPEVPAALARVSPEVAAVRGAGFKLTPNQAMASGTLLGRIAESLAGHAKLERSISRQNAPKVTVAAAQDVGINGPVTPGSIASAKAPHNAVYDELSQLGQIPTDSTYRGVVSGQKAPGVKSFPQASDARVTALRGAYSVPAFDAGDAVAKIRELRQEGNARVYGRYDPAESAYGHAQLAIARALEDQIDRHLQSLSSGEKAGPGTLEGTAQGASAQAPGTTAVSPTVQPTGLTPAASPGTAMPRTVGGVMTQVRPGLLAQRVDEPLAVRLEEGSAPEAATQGSLARSSPIQDWQQQATSLIPRFRAARTALAKLNNFERAFKAGKGEGVSAVNLGKQLERGAPLTGGLRTIAQAAQRFPRAFQDASKIRDNGPFSNLDLKLAAPLAFLKPEALAAFAGPPGIRALLASDRYQRRAFGPFKRPTPVFSRFNRLMLPVAAGTSRSATNQR